MKADAVKLWHVTLKIRVRGLPERTMLWWILDECAEAAEAIVAAVVEDSVGGLQEDWLDPEWQHDISARESVGPVKLPNGDLFRWDETMDYNPAVLCCMIRPRAALQDSA